MSQGQRKKRNASKNINIYIHFSLSKGVSGIILRNSECEEKYLMHVLVDSFNNY